MAHALKKGRNEDLARKRLLHLGAEVRATYPERPPSLNGGPKPWRALARDQSGNKREVRPPPRVSSKDIGQPANPAGGSAATDPRCNGTRGANLPPVNIRLMQPPRFGPAACSHCEQAA